jgi:hypothetical protein
MVSTLVVAPGIAVCVAVTDPPWAARPDNGSGTASGAKTPCWADAGATDRIIAEAAAQARQPRDTGGLVMTESISNQLTRM